jgi:hypothetical protein
LGSGREVYIGAEEHGTYHFITNFLEGSIKTIKKIEKLL